MHKKALEQVALDKCLTSFRSSPFAPVPKGFYNSFILVNVNISLTVADGIGAYRCSWKRFPPSLFLSVREGNASWGIEEEEAPLIIQSCTHVLLASNVICMSATQTFRGREPDFNSDSFSCSDLANECIIPILYPYFPLRGANASKPCSRDEAQVNIRAYETFGIVEIRRKFNN